MVENIGKELGRFEGMELSQTAARIRVTINGLKPLVKEALIEFESGEETIVTLEYEKLMNHCRYCYSLTHETHYCKDQTLSASHIKQTSQYASKEVLRSPQRELTLRPQGAPAYQRKART